MKDELKTKVDELKAKVDDLLAGKTKSPEAVAEVVKKLAAALENEASKAALYRDMALHEQEARVKEERKIKSLKTLIDLF